MYGILFMNVTAVDIYRFNAVITKYTPLVTNNMYWKIMGYVGNWELGR